MANVNANGSDESWMAASNALQASLGKNKAVMVDKAGVWRDGKTCEGCSKSFSFVTRKHHCRQCHGVYCSKCTPHKLSAGSYAWSKAQRMCSPCHSRKAEDAPASDGKSADIPRVPVSDVGTRLTRSKTSEEPVRSLDDRGLPLVVAVSADSLGTPLHSGSMPRYSATDEVHDAIVAAREAALNVRFPSPEKAAKQQLVEESVEAAAGDDGAVGLLMPPKLSPRSYALMQLNATAAASKEKARKAIQERRELTKRRAMLESKTSDTSPV